MDTMYGIWSGFFRGAERKVDKAVLSLKISLYTDLLLPHCNLIQSAGAEGMHTEKENELQSWEERERNGGEEVGLFAPVSITGILGLIIQMWMLLLENTRSRVEALSSTVDQKQSTTQYATMVDTKQTYNCIAKLRR